MIFGNESPELRFCFPSRGARFSDKLLRRLSRTTASGDFIPEVDGLRFIAISAVILHPITDAYLRTTQRLGPVDLPAQWWTVFPRSDIITWGYAGYFGVQFFFVISGFILALPYAQSYRDGAGRPPLRWYYLRRLVRLEPPYIINITLLFLLIALTNPGWQRFISHLAASLFYLHGPVFAEASWVNGVAWSLEVEVQFYLVMPLLATVFAVRTPTVMQAGLAIAILGLAYLVGSLISMDSYPRLKLSLLNYLQFFLAGFLLADLYVGRAVESYSRSYRGDIIAALAGAGIFLILTRRYDLYYLTPLLILALYIGLFLGRLGHFCIRQRWIVAIGGMCYTIYLDHFMVIDLIAPWTMQLASPERALWQDFMIPCLLMIPAILLSSALLFVLVEKPFMILSRAVGGRRRMQPSASGNPTISMLRSN
ncbi:MAG: acyltransferase [Candidatus Competibacteraceae bacterium]